VLYFRKEMIVFANGNKAKKDIKLVQTSKEEEEAALELLEQIEREVEAEDTDSPLGLEVDEETSKHLKLRLSKHTLDLINAKDIRRQRMEEVRANHRNLNRMLTLLAALVIGLVVTYGLSNMGFPFIGIHFPAMVKSWAPYAFVITVALDSFLAAYSYLKHY